MMRRIHPLFMAALALILGLLLGCSSGSTSNISKTTTPQITTGSVDVILSDDSTEDWATIGVKVLSISLTPQGGGSPVMVFTAPSPVPVINLVQLDQLGELIANAQIPAGTYTSATITISANPGDVMLTAAADPEAGFAGTAAATVPSSQIQIQGTTGAAGSLTTTVSVNLVSPLVVTAGQSNQLDLEFDLSHPAFIVDHTPASGGSTFWAINFKGPVRHHPIANIASFLLRDTYGMVTAVAANNTSITITRVFAVRPAANPETAITSTASRTILADAVNGTIFYDVDAKSRSVIKDFSSVAGSLTGKYVRIAARYQVDGSLVAVRVWASTTFNNLWLSPEGHVLHVNKTTNVITVENEAGVGVPVTVDSNTQFFFRAPVERHRGFHTHRDRHQLRRQRQHRARIQSPRERGGSAGGPAGGAVGGHRAGQVRRDHLLRQLNQLHVHAQIQHACRQLHLHRGLREQFQVVVLHLPHAGHYGLDDFRGDGRRRSEFRRDGGHAAGLGNERKHLG